MSYELVYTRQATKDAKKLKGTPHAKKARELLEIVREDPFTDPPPFEALVGDLKGAYSRRISIQHRLVYAVFAADKVFRVIRLWTHYEQDPNNASI